MKFKLEANMIFEADDVDGAFLRLSQHFLDLHNEKDSNLLLAGEIEISRFEEEKFTFFWSGPFSQWHPCMIVIDSVTYNCAEQFMMAQKAKLFNDEETYNKIMLSKDPKEQKALGRQVKDFDVEEWQKIAKDVVYKGSYAKYTQNEDLKKILLDTKGTTLVEASPYDKIWGIGLKADDLKAKDRKTWRGKNWLGEILTQVREDIISENNNYHIY